MASLEFKDEEAFESFYKDHYEALCRFAMRYLDFEATSRDLVQDLFVSLWINRNNIKITTSVKAYLYTAVRNKSLSRLRSKLGIVQLPDDSHELMIYPDNLDYPALETAVNNAIARLPEKCRSIFELSRDHGMKNHQIAEKLNISEKTVENQMTIALGRLRLVTKEFFSVILF